MTDPLILAFASSALLAIGIASAALLKGWTDWLEVRRLELRSGRRSEAPLDLSELKRRVRRLEAIADGAER